MKSYPIRTALAALGLLLLLRPVAYADEPAASARLSSREAVSRLIAAATNSSFAFERLTRLCDTFGPRLQGSTNLEAALDWVTAELKKDGFTNVRGEEVPVHRWVRGQESAELLHPFYRRLAMLGLGNSIATPPGGVTGEVCVVKSFDDLQSRPAEARGKIVLFNQPFTEYGKTVRIRTRGAIEAGRAGALASLIRSVTDGSLQSPHTGRMYYSNDVPKISHAALSAEDAALLQRLQDAGLKPVVRLTMSAQTLPQIPSRNILAEIPGREKPDEIVLVSGHMDSWDVGQGAMDDAGGCVAVWEAARLIHQLGLAPRRTIRVVFWNDEENTVMGAKLYRERHLAELPKHVLALECDEGTFQPTGWGFTGTPAALAILQNCAAPLAALGCAQVATPAVGVDIARLEADQVPLLDLLVDQSKYFWYHHSDADTVDKLSPLEFNRCVAALAVMTYLVADHPEPLPRE